MRLCLIPCAMLLASCGPGEPPPPALRPGAALANPAPLVDPALYETCPGWIGAAPVTMADFVAATEAEIDCRRRMAAQLDALAGIGTGPR